MNQNHDALLTLAGARPDSFHDWQFWVVTLVCAGALLWRVRGVVRWGKRNPLHRAPTRKATLTIDRKPVSKH